jgi:hypothetical protein
MLASMTDEASQGLSMLRYESTMSDRVWYLAHPVAPMQSEIDEICGHGAGVVALADAARYVVTRNLDNAKAWLSWIRDSFPAVTFIAPWIVAIESGEDDSDPQKRERGLRDDERVVARCDGVVLCGGRVSSGMAREAARAVTVADLTTIGRHHPRYLAK